MVDIYFSTFIYLGIAFGAIAVSLFGLGLCDPTTPTLLWISLGFAVLLGIFFLVTPSVEKMIVQEYDDILNNRPECAEEVDKGLDSASMECLRVYKAYLVDSIAAADRYKHHFEKLKAAIKR